MIGGIDFTPCSISTLASEKLLITNTIYRSSYNAKEGEFVQPTSSSSLRSSYHVRVRDIGFRSDVDYFSSEKHHFQTGIHIVDHQFDSSVDASIYRSEGAQDSLFQESFLDALENNRIRPTSLDAIPVLQHSARHTA